MSTAKQLTDELIYRMKTTDLNKFEIEIRNTKAVFKVIRDRNE